MCCSNIVLKIHGDSIYSIVCSVNPLPTSIDSVDNTLPLYGLSLFISFFSTSHFWHILDSIVPMKYGKNIKICPSGKAVSSFLKEYKKILHAFLYITFLYISTGWVNNLIWNNKKLFGYYIEFKEKSIATERLAE